MLRHGNLRGRRLMCAVCVVALLRLSYALLTSPCCLRRQMKREMRKEEEEYKRSKGKKTLNFIIYFIFRFKKLNFTFLLCVFCLFLNSVVVAVGLIINGSAHACFLLLSSVFHFRHTYIRVLTRLVTDGVRLAFWRHLICL